MAIPLHFNQEGLTIDCEDLLPLLSSTDEKLAYLAGSLIQHMRELEMLTPEQDELWNSNSNRYTNQCIANASNHFAHPECKAEEKVGEILENVRERVKGRLEDPTTGEKEKKAAEIVSPILTQLPDIFKAVFSAFAVYNGADPVAPLEESTNTASNVEGSM